MGSSQSKNNSNSKRKSAINTRATNKSAKNNNNNTAGIKKEINITNNAQLNIINNNSTKSTTSINTTTAQKNNYTTYASSTSLQTASIKNTVPTTITTTTTPLESQSLISVGIDMYTTGTPSTLIRDHLAVQPLSSLFPTDLHLADSTCPQSTITSLSSNSSSFTELSDLFSNISIETPNSTFSSISGQAKHSSTTYSKNTLTTTNNNNTNTTTTTFSESNFNDGLSSTLVTPINEEKTPTTIKEENDKNKQVTVAQSKIYSGDQSSIIEGFRQLTYLAETHQCVESFYPLAECYYLGHHDPTSHQPNIPKSFYWFSRVADLPSSSSSSSSLYSSIPPSTIAWAQYRIAMMLAKGDDGVDADAEKALYYFLLAADKDNKCAQYMVGLHYQYGLLSNQNPDIKLALYWFHRAACQGFSDAQVSLSLLVLENLNSLTNGSAELQNKSICTSIQWLELAAKQNNVYAHLYLGGLYEEGELVTRNAKKAMYHYEAALSIDDPISNNQIILAHYFVGIHYRLGKLVDQDYAKAIKHLNKAAVGGYAPAQRALGLMYREGSGLVKNEKTAYEWITKAAMQGDIQSIGLLGHLAEQGRGCKMDINAAINLYSKAALSGSIMAKLSLANILSTTGHYAEAYPWYESVANDDQTLSTQTNKSLISPSSTTATKVKNNIGYVRQRNTARLMLARYKFNGWGGVMVDRSLAYREFKYLSDVENHSEAHYWVGACYEEGIKNQDGVVLVKRDVKKAFDYYLKCAQNGYVDGEFQVALMLANGCRQDNTSNNESKMIIEKDSLRAFKWYSKAAEHGHAMAQYSLGLFYERGLSPIHSIQLKEAKIWYERSAKQQNTIAMISLAQLLLQETEESSHQEAVKWLQLATMNENDKHYTTALRSLASVFEKGNVIDVPSDPQRYDTALQLLKKAATKKDPLAFVEMARYYEQGLGIEKNIYESLICLVQSEKLGYKKAKMAIADLYYRNKMWDKALESYDAIINSNPILTKPGWTARLNVSKLLLLENITQDVPMDFFQNVFSWLQTMVEKATGLVAVEPLELLGLCYEYGRGVTKDILFASTMYEKATKVKTEEMNWIQERARFRLIEVYMQTEQYTLAWNQLQNTIVHLNEMNRLNSESRKLARTIRFYLGFLLLHGEQKDVSEAKNWLIQAADEGEGNAALELARLCILENDIQTARSRLEQGISSGHSGCMIQLALLLEQTNTDEEDDSNEMTDLLERAMELGNIQATYHRGRLYHLAFLKDGSNLDNATNALSYYSTGAEQNDKSSMVGMGQLYSSLEQHQNAILWFEKTQHEPISVIMMAMYQLQSDMNNNNNSELSSTVAFKEFTTVVQNFWENCQQLSKMDRESISALCFFLGQFYNQNNKSLAQVWFKRSVDCNQHTVAMYQLGILSEEKGDHKNAMYWFHSAAEQKRYVKAFYKLGLYHANGIGGLEINSAAARQYFKKAKEEGDEESAKLYALERYKQALDIWYNQKKYKYGFKLFEEAAEYVPEASLKLAELYHYGFSYNNHSGSEQDKLVLHQNYKQASEYYTCAAKNGLSKAAMIMGSLYENGELEESDDEFITASYALQWYEDAYQQNHGSLAELAMARMKHKMADILLANGNSNEEALNLQDEAYDWFKSFVESFLSTIQLSNEQQGDQDNEETKEQVKYAQVMMARYCLNGWGRKERNPAEGFNMLLELIQENDNSDSNIKAISEIAMCYEQGNVVDKDMNQALVFWEAAAKLDDVDALRRIAEIYRLGLTGEYNIEKANYYYNCAENIETKQNDCNKSVCSMSTNSSSSSSSYMSRRASMASFNSQ